MGIGRIDAAGSGSNTGSGMDQDVPVRGAPVPGGSTPAAGNAPAGSNGFSFHALLEDLNPLQYIPVVGSIYRAVTGDEGNPTLRFVASLGTSFALGGPLGLGLTVGEKVLGIDPEKIGRHLLARLLHPHATATVSEAGGGTTTPPASATASAAAAPGPARGWTARELAAYGIRRDAQDTLSGPAGRSGADLLNDLELGRLRAAAA